MALRRAEETPSGGEFTLQWACHRPPQGFNRPSSLPSSTLQRTVIGPPGYLHPSTGVRKSTRECTVLHQSRQLSLLIRVIGFTLLSHDPNPFHHALVFVREDVAVQDEITPEIFIFGVHGGRTRFAFKTFR